MERIITTKELAETLRLSEGTIRKRVRDEQWDAVPKPVLGGGTKGVALGWAPETVRAFMGIKEQS